MIGSSTRHRWLACRPDNLGVQHIGRLLRRAETMPTVLARMGQPHPWADRLRVWPLVSDATNPGCDHGTEDWAVGAASCARTQASVDDEWWIRAMAAHEEDSDLHRMNLFPREQSHLHDRYCPDLVRKPGRLEAAVRQHSLRELYVACRHPVRSPFGEFLRGCRGR